MNTLWCISLIAGDKKRAKPIVSTSTVQIMCVKSLNIALILKLCSSDVYTGNKEGSILTQVIRSVKNVNVSLLIINLIKSIIIRSKFDFAQGFTFNGKHIFTGLMEDLIATTDILDAEQVGELHWSLCLFCDFVHMCSFIFQGILCLFTFLRLTEEHLIANTDTVSKRVLILRTWFLIRTFLAFWVLNYV